MTEAEVDKLLKKEQEKKPLRNPIDNVIDGALLAGGAALSGAKTVVNLPKLSLKDKAITVQT